MHLPRRWLKNAGAKYALICKTAYHVQQVNITQQRQIPGEDKDQSRFNWIS
jgi:hypothetical protein